MSGSTGWIKLEKDLYTDPRLRRMATLLGERAAAPDPHARLLATCVGAVCILWMFADTHVDENDILSLGPAEIDELTGIERVCELLPPDWLHVLDKDRVKLPGFHTHNGTKAKKTAVDTKRQQRHRKRRA